MTAHRAPSDEVSRRALCRAAAALAGAAVLGLAAPREAAGAATKIAQAAAKYQDHPHGSQHCAICTYFEPPSSCKLVAGRIVPNGWCELFSPKKSPG
jgi:hypothetical protein